MYSDRMDQVQPVIFTPVPFTPLSCKGDPAEVPFQPVDSQGLPERSEGGGSRIVCRACGNLVTSAAARMQVEGKHRHVFFNPHGIMFELGCFQAAPGTVRTGPPVSEFSWFSGHTWQIAVCGRCSVHLGWYYEAARTGFYGLILPALSEEED